MIRVDELMSEKSVGVIQTEERKRLDRTIKNITPNGISMRVNKQSYAVPVLSPPTYQVATSLVDLSFAREMSCCSRNDNGKR